MDFTTQEPADRAALLLDAADRLDRLSGHLGDDAGAPHDPYSQLLRDLVTDTAQFAAFPDLRPLPDINPAHADADQFRLQDRFSFWWLRMPLLLFPRRNWAFNRLEVRIEFSPGEVQPERRPKAFDILPNRRFDTVMKAGVQVALGVGADGHFSVATPDVALGSAAGGSLQAGAGVQASGSLATNLALGPVQFRSVAAKVDHSAEGLEKVFWRLDGSEFFQENQPELVVVLQVPKGVTSGTVVGVLQAYRRFNLFPAGLQAAIRQLPEAMRVFFAGGSPLAAQASYDLSFPRKW